jgi:hypothetical protein
VFRLGCVFEKSEEIGAHARILDAGERHDVARNQLLRVPEPLIERGISPDNAG